MLPFPPDFITALLKTYISQFPLPNTSRTSFNKKLWGIVEGKSKVWRDEQASEPESHMELRLELPDQEF